MNDINITDQRKDTWSKIPHYCLALLSATEYKLYGALDSYRNRKTGQLNPSLEKLAVKAGVSFGRISAYLKRLEAKQVITMERHHRRPSQIFLIDPPGASDELEILDTLNGGPKSILGTPDGGSRKTDEPPSGGSNYPNPISENQNKERELELPRKDAATPRYARKYRPDIYATARTLTAEFRAHAARVRPGDPPFKSTFGRDIKFMCIICDDLLDHWGIDHIRGMWNQFLQYNLAQGRSLDMKRFFDSADISHNKTGGIDKGNWHHEQIKREENSFGRRPAPARDPYGI